MSIKFDDMFQLEMSHEQHDISGNSIKSEYGGNADTKFLINTKQQVIL